MDIPQKAPNSSRLDHTNLIDSSLLWELKKINIEISLLQAIKDIPKINQLIKSLYVKTPGFPPTIQLGTKLTDVLLGRLLPQDYSDLGSPVITLSVGGIEIPNVLID